MTAASFVVRLAFLRRNYKMSQGIEPKLDHLRERFLKSQDLINHVKKEMHQLILAFQEKQDNLEIVKLKSENLHLQSEINLVKNELIELQISNGVQQIPIPGEMLDKQEQMPKAPALMNSVSSINVPSKASPVENSDRSNIAESKPSKAAKPKKVVTPAANEPSVDVGRLDIRVGQIVGAKVHPDADQLYLEQIDIGEENPRTVVSGLVKHIPLCELDKRMVLVLCNLKPQKMRGIMSEAMVLCASTPEKVELLCPPSEAKAGDKVTVSGYIRNPDLPFMNPKKKIFETLAEDLKVDSNKRATYKDVPWEVEGKPGYITTQSLTGCFIK